MEAIQMVTQELFEKAPWNVKLRTVRSLKGLSQKELAERVGTSPRVYNNWELGKFKPIEIFQEAISRAVGVPRSEIFTFNKRGV
jgi:transcriptional regulator with XRE-family HTH domain